LALHPAGDTSLKHGEGLIVYVALVYERYWSEAARTLKVEGGSLLVPEPGKWETFYGELVECLAPGKALSQCARDIKARMVAQGGDRFSEYGLGQGIGLSPGEWPRLEEDAEGTLESGMCLTLRACVRDKDLGAVMVGNTLAVTEKGVEVLTA
jgi:Xaa-Pro dipeptidase